MSSSRSPATSTGRWILVTEGGHGQSRAAVAATRAAHRLGYHVTVTMSDRLSLAGFSRHCERRLRVPLADIDAAGYQDAVRAELLRRDYLAVLPASDAAVAALGGRGADLVDKSFAYERAAQVGFPVPPTVVASTREAALEVVRDWVMPVVIKPPVKRAAARRIGTFAELLALEESVFPALVQPYLTSGLRGVLGVMWRGDLVAATHLRYLRTWPTPCGTVAAAVTTTPDSVVEAQLRALLHDYDGIFHVDLAGEHLLDVNPRIHALLPLSAAAGANLVAAYCGVRAGCRVPPMRARPGVSFRWLEGDVRNAVASIRTGERGVVSAVRGLRPRRGTVHSFASIGDPLPSVARLGYAVRRWAR